MASSWLYDVRIAIGYRIFGLLYIPMLAIACKFALAVLTFLLAGGLRGRFWPAVLLSATAQFVLINLPPLPLYSSVLLFAIELILLMQARSTGSVRPLYWLPLLFLVWANLDVQFVVGVIVILVFLAATVIERWGERTGIAWLQGLPNNSPDDDIASVHDSPIYSKSRNAEALRQGTTSVVPISRLPLIRRADFSPRGTRFLGAITAASLLATFITPYGWNLYGDFFARATSAANPYFPDFQALRFRSPQDYLLLLLIASAFLALGMRRSRDLFQIALLLLCTFAAFHSQRDAWMATLAAVAIVGNALPDSRSQVEGASSQFSKSRLLIAASVAIALLVAAAAIHFPRGRQAALAKVGKHYPVAAADYIRDHRLPQPLFNSLPWGGFLTWYLPEYPVAIDGRTDLYGDDFNIQYAKVMNADAHFSTFPAFNQAATLLLEKNSLMGAALATVPGFRVAYSDNVAVVLVREQPVP
jgi:hypothetical protein